MTDDQHEPQEQSKEDKLFARMLGRGAPRLPIVPDPEPRRNPEEE